MDKLPEELILQILTYLDTGEPPSQRCILDLPGAASLMVDDAPLKNLSSTCRVLRRLTTPLLFRHLRMDLYETIPLIQEAKVPEGFSDLWAPPALRFLIADMSLITMASSIVLYQKSNSPQIPPGIDPALYSHVKHFFSRLFEQIERVAVIAPPQTVGLVLDCDVSMKDSWAFNITYQRIDLCRSAMGRPHGLRGIELKFFLAGQYWDKLSFNGHSCLPSYGTYHYFEKHPPCPLTAVYPLAERPFPAYEIGYNLVDFSYTILFPHVNHFRNVLHQISAHFNKLKHFQIRLAPDPDSTVWQDHDYIGRGSLNLRDCWSEIERCHDELMRRLVPGTFRLKYVDKVTIHDARIPSVGLQLDAKFQRIGSNWQKQDNITWEIRRSN